MKLLVAYDGSNCADAALDDLVLAGLPQTGEALVMSVAEVWLPPRKGNGRTTGIHLDAEYDALIKRHYERNQHLLAEARASAEQAAERLRQILQGWSVDAEATYGSPAWELLNRAEAHESDLIVVGSHGHSAVGRFLMGSISQKIATEARCSVRIARGRVQIDPTPVRIVIGYDCSIGAQAAVEAVAQRHWPDQSEVRLIAATHPVTPSIVEEIIPTLSDIVDETNADERDWITRSAAKAMDLLRSAKIHPTLNIHAGNPKYVLVEEAEKWSADCIFVGANAHGGPLTRFLIGSTSAAVAARAHCSVEVIRKNS